MNKVDKNNKIEELLTRRVEKIYPSKEALEKVLRSGKKLRVYQGFDPSTPNLHIGHLVGLLKLRDFQKQGHEVIFLIGDFTGMIGDPTGKKSARKKLTQKEVLENAKTYKEQAGKILNFSGENPVKIMFNSTWNSVLKFAEVLELFSHVTAQQLIERDMFQERIKKGEEIYFHELCYPIIQGYDSVAMEVDLEIGGSDQMFNMLVGRDLLKKLKNKEKFVLTTPLLVDSKGEKIGKTEGNAINLTDKPEDFYGKIMSLGDDCIIPCFSLITDVDMRVLRGMKEMWEKGKVNPMELKKKLAWELTRMLNGKEAADFAQKEFERTVQGREMPEKITNYKLQITNWEITDLLVEVKLCSSKSQAKRLILQGGVEVNSKKITDPNLKITVSDGMIVRCGKRNYIRICLNS